MGEDAIIHAINETEVTAVITTHDLLPKFKNILPLTPSVNTIIFIQDEASKSDTTSIEQCKKDITLHSFKHIQSLGENSSVKGMFISIGSLIGLK